MSWAGAGDGRLVISLIAESSRFEFGSFVIQCDLPVSFGLLAPSTHSRQHITAMSQLNWARSISQCLAVLKKEKKGVFLKPLKLVLSLCKPPL